MYDKIKISRKEYSYNKLTIQNLEPVESKKKVVLVPKKISTNYYFLFVLLTHPVFCTLFPLILIYQFLILLQF